MCFKNSSVKLFKLLIIQTYRQEASRSFETEDAMIIRYIVLERVNVLKWEIIVHGLYRGKMGLFHFEEFNKINLDVTIKHTTSQYIFINIKDWTLLSVPSPELQLLAPTLLGSSNCSPSLWSVVV